MTRLAPNLLLALALAGSLAACDSNDDGPDPSDVAGIYNVTTFSFDPDIGVLPTIDVLGDTLEAGQTSLEILDGGQVLFRYRRQGGTARVLTGEASVRSEQVRITFDSDSGTLRQRILLPNQVTFDRDGSTLSAEEEATVDLEAYSPRYGRDGTFDSVDGTLLLTLTPRG